MDEPISNLACRVQAACSNNASTMFEGVEIDVRSMQAALIQAQLSLADVSLFSISRLKAYVEISNDCRSSLLELQHLIDYHSQPGLTNIRHSGVQVILRAIQERLQLGIDELASLDVLDTIDEIPHTANTLEIPIIHISTPLSPWQDQTEPTNFRTHNERPSTTTMSIDSSSQLLPETVTVSMPNSPPPISGQRWSQASSFQISLETVLEEFDDAQSDSGSSADSKSSVSSRSSCSERTVTPPPLGARIARAGDHREPVEIVFDQDDSYVHSTLSEEVEFGSPTLFATVPFLKPSLAHEYIEPQLDQYSPSYQLKKRSSEPRSPVFELPGTQSTPDDEAANDAHISSRLTLRRQTRWSFQQEERNINPQRDSQDNVDDKEQAVTKTLDEFHWLDDELQRAEQDCTTEVTPDIHQAPTHPIHRQSALVIKSSSKQHLSIAYCNSQRRSQNFPSPTPPPFYKAPSQSQNSLPIKPAENQNKPTVQSPAHSIRRSYLYPTPRPRRCQSTSTGLVYIPLQNNIFSRSVPNLNAIPPAHHTMSSPGLPPARPPPPPPLPAWITAPYIDDTTQNVHVTGSKPVFMESLRGLKISLQPPTAAVKGRRSFQRLSSMFQKPRVPDSFFDHGD